MVHGASCKPVLLDRDAPLQPVFEWRLAQYVISSWQHIASWELSCSLHMIRGSLHVVCLAAGC